MTKKEAIIDAVRNYKADTQEAQEIINKNADILSTQGSSFVEGFAWGVNFAFRLAHFKLIKLGKRLMDVMGA